MPKKRNTRFHVSGRPANWGKEGGRWVDTEIISSGPVGPVTPPLPSENITNQEDTEFIGRRGRRRRRTNN